MACKQASAYSFDLKKIKTYSIKPKIETSQPLACFLAVSQTPSSIKNVPKISNNCIGLKEGSIDCIKAKIE